MFPLTSTTVRVTEFVPKSAHVNVSFDKYIVSIAQLSKLPSLISLNPIEALPIESKKIVAFLHIAVGGTVSNIVTVAVQVEELPLASCAVKVIIFAPVSAQVNEL